MNNKIIKFALAAMVFNQLLPEQVFADASSLKDEIATLKEQVAKLEAKLSSEPEKKGEELSPIKSLTDGIQVSGMVDTTFSYNFNSPTSKTNVGRVFDNDADSMNLNVAKLTFQKAVSAEDPVGFRADLFAGEDAKLIHSAGLGDSNDSFDLQQAYIEINLGSSKIISGMNDISLKLGKFVTLAGAEVIEAKDNWNTSRGLLFGYAEPFSHTGIRATYTFDNSWDIALGVNNGWDVTEDNNGRKTFEAHVGLNGIALPGDSSLTVAMQGYYGPEAADDNGSDRALGDLVVTYKTPWKPLTLVYSFDYATQDHLAEDGGSADWYGHAGYFRIDLADDWAVVGRGEYFNDSDGVRVVPGTSAHYREFTGTLEHRPWKNIITRLEYRNDHASKSVYDDSKSRTTNSQNTLSGEVIYSF